LASVPPEVKTISAGKAPTRAALAGAPAFDARPRRAAALVTDEGLPPR